MAGKFGRYLIDGGYITEEQLAEALRSQAVYGGRLGTNLIELGYSSLDELATCLGDFQDTPEPPIEWLEAPDPRAIRLVPMALLRRHKILPLRLEAGEIHVAMLDPRDATQCDYIAAASSRRVVPYMLPEARLLYWLEVHLQMDRHPRYVNLASRQRQTGRFDSELGCASSEIELGGQGVGTKASAASPAWSHEPEAISLGEELKGDEELLLDELVEELPGPAEEVAPLPTSFASQPATSSEVAALEAELQGASERDEIIRLALRLARVYCQAAVLFLVRGDTVRGFRAAGAAQGAGVDGIELPISTQSVFAMPAATGVPFRGSPPEEGGIDGRLLEAIERSDVQELVVEPIAIRGRVVNLLYCDNGADVFGETSVAALRALCQSVAGAYERLILDTKTPSS